MKTAYVEVMMEGLAAHNHVKVAIEGLAAMGYRIVYVKNRHIPDLAFDGIDKGDVAVGDVAFTHAAIEHLGTPAPDLPDYPDALRPLLGRKVVATTLGAARNGLTGEFDDVWPIFVKPALPKQFEAKVIESERDWQGVGDDIPGVGPETPVWLSEVVCFVSEYRVLIHRGEVVGAKHYLGDDRIRPDGSVVDRVTTLWRDAPIAYSADLGVTDYGETLLVEVNDFYALGAYGLAPAIYAQCLVDRFKQIVGE